MCYRCEVCARVSPRGKPLLRHQLMRRDSKGRRQIEREVSVCRGCHQLLVDGVPFKLLVEQRGRPKVVRSVGGPKLLKKFDFEEGKRRRA